MTKNLLAAAVENRFPPYRSAFSLHAAWRMVWRGDQKTGRWQMILPTVWGWYVT